jgi:hypothetical protein
MIHKGNALIATITATFHPNRTETTKDRSGRLKVELKYEGEEDGIQERTEIFGEEDHAEGVDAEGNNLRNDHVDVPGGNESSYQGPGRSRVDVPDRNFQCNHDQFVEDQRGERYGDNVQKLVLEQNKGYNHNRCA